MALKSGKLGFFRLNGSPWGKQLRHEFDCDGDLPDVSYFEAGGGHVRVDGVTDNQITVSGPYDVGSMPVTRGTQYTAACGLDTGITLSCVVRCKSWKVTNEYTDAARFEAVFQASDGSNFLASLS